MIIRRENKDDYILIDELLHSIFKNDIKSNLVNEIRNNKNYINELSLIAEDTKEITGYIIFSKIFIKENTILHQGVHISLLSVNENFQNQGVGKALIRQGLLLAHALGYNFVTTSHNINYFEKFGFHDLNIYNIKTSIPSTKTLILELKNNYLTDISGVLQ